MNTRPSHPRLIALLSLSLALVGLGGCSPAFVAIGDQYKAQGATSVALAYYDVQVGLDPSDVEARGAWAVTYQVLAQEQRREIERLVSAQQARRALGRLARLEELAQRAQHLGVPADAPSWLSDERKELESVARQEVLAALDRRAERGALVWADVEVCRQWAALAPRDPMTRRCDAMADRFRYYLAVVPETNDPLSRGVADRLVRALKSSSTDRVQVVSEGDPKMNARLWVQVTPPTIQDSGERLLERRTCRTWLKKRDKRGRLVQHEFKVDPKPAMKTDPKTGKKQPAPKPRVIKKQVWFEVVGELKRFGQDRTAVVPWSAALHDLRADTLIATTRGQSNETAKRRWGTVTGDQRACGSPGLSGRAQAMPAGGQLANKAAGRIPEGIRSWLIKRLD